MVSFLRSNEAIVAALLALSSLSATEAAYVRLYVEPPPSAALGSRMLSALHGPSFFSQDVARVMHDVDAMFDTMLGRVDLYKEPFDLQRMGRSSYLLQGSPALKALTQGRAKNNKDLARTAYGITQDDKQLQIVVNVPGAKASDVRLQLEEEDHLLRIYSETKREDEGINVQSRFERSFTLSRAIDTSNISAVIENGVLTITAPKYKAVKESTRQIDVVEGKPAESDNAVKVNEEAKANVSPSHEKDESQKVKDEVDESVIDLDMKSEGEEQVL